LTYHTHDNWGNIQALIRLQTLAQRERDKELARIVVGGGGGGGRASTMLFSESWTL
jgi:hypothetical protein